MNFNNELHETKNNVYLKHARSHSALQQIKLPFIADQPIKINAVKHLSVEDFPHSKITSLLDQPKKENELINISRKALLKW